MPMSGPYAEFKPARPSTCRHPAADSVPKRISRQDGPVRLRPVLATLLLCGLVVSGCTRGGSLPTPSTDPESAAQAAAELAAGLAKKDLSAVEFAGADSATVNNEFAAVVAGMGPIASAVQVSEVDGQGDAAT